MEGCENVDFDNDSANTRKAKKDFEVSQAILLLQQSQWFKSVNLLPNHSSPRKLPIVTDTLLKRWKTSIKEQESIITAVGGTYVAQPLFSFFGQICEEH